MIFSIIPASSSGGFSFFSIGLRGGILGGWNLATCLIFSSVDFSAHPEINPSSMKKLTKIGIAFFIFSAVFLSP
ncbi:MAG TPA: hypothetical protein HA348_04715 [Thermoplasmata archaeon]|nr:hypothetical protein [Thermoplasmata archaeon]